MIEWFGGVLLIIALCLIVRYTNEFGVFLYWLLAVSGAIMLLLFLFAGDGGFFTWGSKFWNTAIFISGLNVFLSPCVKENKNAREIKKMKF
jgi:hypothetical protein